MHLDIIHSHHLIYLFSGILFLTLIIPATHSAGVSPRSIASLNEGWRFSQGDPPGVSEQLAYEKIKPWLLPAVEEFTHFSAVSRVRPAGDPGSGVLYVQPEYTDNHWRSLSLPHDWGIEGPFEQTYPGETGKLPWAGVGWYRKSFAIPASDRDKRIYLAIDGAMSYSTVWLNGHFVGGWPYGYTSFQLDLTPYVNYGSQNYLAVRCDNPPESSRWYPGAGIYRNVWLIKTDPVHVEHWGTFVTTPVITREQATIDLQVVLKNNSASEVRIELLAKIYAVGTDCHPIGEPLAIADPVKIKVPANRQAFGSASLFLTHPRLWDLKNPHQYVIKTEVQKDGQICDEVETLFGIRSISATSDTGFMLNGERVRLQGVCLHHDLGALGTAINRRALERQIEMLQEMGCNAIRTSHNPPAPELLELCDRMGMLVMDEAFDCWQTGKKNQDYHLLFADWHEADLRALIRRDRNHPCVVMWSIGNEVPDQWQPEGWKLASHMAAIVREEDRTRPITSGYNNTQSGYNGFQKAVDILGFNYKPDEYGRFHQHNPHIPVFGSETSSCVSSRGVYYFPVSDNKDHGRMDFQVSSYDLYAPSWAFPPDIEFKGLDEHPAAAGEFVWTGFDYLGEPTPYNDDAGPQFYFSDPERQSKAKQEMEAFGKIHIPSRSSYFGIIDLAGLKKDRFYLYQARWRPDLPMAHILPHWNWPERVGQITPVHVYTSGDEAELFLNGVSLGRKSKASRQYRLRWDEVVYQPGELRVEVYRSGKPWAQDIVRTTAAASQLKLTVDRSVIRADGEDLAFVTCAVQDADGLTVPRSKPLISFEMSGPGKIVAIDNGDATSHQSFQALSGHAYNGLTMIIVRSQPGDAGQVRLKAKAEKLKSGSITIECK